MEEKKTRLTAGADELTPSRSQYFSWINNTNEGSTEKQTLINLDYFKWLHDEYGMKLDIYAWDAGNLDGSRGTYETLDSPKITAQYPRGYAPITEAAKSIGTRLGVWCGPDGFGDTPEDAKKRHEQMVSLCRDYNFALFKIDGVCGDLRESKRGYFVDMMRECRRYQPDLILLNHRLELGIGNPYATTFLWEGLETYIDVHVCNQCTAPHHRAYLFDRNLVPGLERLAEDHGVCISSCPDYFEDDLIYQAFNRCLILAPEIYGNPWFLRDDEQAHLARIYNLHRRWGDILVNAVVLPDEYSHNATARGDGRVQFLTLGNPSWETKKVSIHLGAEIGLKECARVAVTAHHPYERYLGEYAWGDTAEIEIEPFRAALIDARDASLRERVLTGCEYEVLHETDGTPDRVKIVSAHGEVGLADADGTVIKHFDIEPFDSTPRAPRKLGTTRDFPVPANAEALLEATLFAADNDSLEARAVRRSGETKIPQVKAARDAFFAQKRYFLRGCEGAFAFDGRRDTFFDGSSKTDHGGVRVEGGCLRVDFGGVYDADSVTIEYFSPFEPHVEFFSQTIPERATYSCDLSVWKTSEFLRTEILEDNAEIEVIKKSIHSLYTVRGQRRRLVYPIDGSLRYFRLPCPVDKIFSIAIQKSGEEIIPAGAKVNNLFSPAAVTRIAAAKTVTVRVEKEDVREGSFLAVAVERMHDTEGAYAAAEVDGRLYGFPDRAVSYPSNFWECPTRPSRRGYTYYLPLTEELVGRDVKITVFALYSNKTNIYADVWLCDANREIKGVVLDLNS